MKYNVTLICPGGYPHSAALMDIALAVAHSLNTELTFNKVVADHEVMNIIIGYHLLPLLCGNTVNAVNWVKGARFIIYQLEPLALNDCAFVKASVPLLYYAEAVWDYCQSNIDTLEEQGIFAELLVPGHSETNVKAVFTETQAKVHQVLFYGSIGRRRGKVLSELRRAGINVLSLYGVYGPQRDALIAKSQLVINIHQHSSSDPLETVRLSYLLSNGVPFVSETSVVDPAPYAGLGSWNEKYLNLADYVIDLLNYHDVEGYYRGHKEHVLLTFRSYDFPDMVRLRSKYTYA